MLNPSLLLVSALFFLGASAVFYMIGWMGVTLLLRLMPGLSARANKTLLFVTLLVPPGAAVLLTGGGALLRHIHTQGMEHHNSACGDMYRLLTAPQGQMPPAIGILLISIAWLLLALGVLAVARLLRATESLARGLTPYLEAPSSKLAAALAHAQPRVKAAGIPFYEAAVPMGYSCLVGISRVRCVLSKQLVASSTEAELAAVLAHEANHVRAGDVWSTLLVGMINCLFFFLRPVRLLSRRWREETELACDAATVATTGEPLALASAILRTQGVEVPSRALPTVALGFADEAACTSEKRVRRLLAYANEAGKPMDTPRHGVWQWAVTLLLFITGAALLMTPQMLCTAHCSLEAISKALH